MCNNYMSKYKQKEKVTTKNNGKIIWSIIIFVICILAYICLGVRLVYIKHVIENFNNTKINNSSISIKEIFEIYNERNTTKLSYVNTNSNIYILDDLHETIYKSTLNTNVFSNLSEVLTPKLEIDWTHLPIKDLLNISYFKTLKYILDMNITGILIFSPIIFVIIIALFPIYTIYILYKYNKHFFYKLILCYIAGMIFGICTILPIYPLCLLVYLIGYPTTDMHSVGRSYLSEILKKSTFYTNFIIILLNIYVLFICVRYFNLNTQVVIGILMIGGLINYYFTYCPNKHPELKPNVGGTTDYQLHPNNMNDVLSILPNFIKKIKGEEEARLAELARQKEDAILAEQDKYINTDQDYTDETIESIEYNLGGIIGENYDNSLKSLNSSNQTNAKSSQLLPKVNSSISDTSESDDDFLSDLSKINIP